VSFNGGKIYNLLEARLWWGEIKKTTEDYEKKIAFTKHVGRVFGGLAIKVKTKTSEWDGRKLGIHSGKQKATGKI